MQGGVAALEQHALLRVHRRCFSRRDAECILVEPFSAGHEAAVIAAAAAAGVGLYPVSALYDPAAPRPEVAGLILGYAGLDPAAILRGVAVLARVLGC